jgi:hypothetical protein
LAEPTDSALNLQPASTIDKVIDTMTAIQASLDSEDGVACFNGSTSI